MTSLSWRKLRNGKRLEIIGVHLSALSDTQRSRLVEFGYGSTLLSPSFLPETLPRSSRAAVGQISRIGSRDFELRLQMAAS